MSPVEKQARLRSVAALDQMRAIARDEVARQFAYCVDLFDRINAADFGKPFEPADEAEAIFVLGLAGFGLAIGLREARDQMTRESGAT